MEIEVKLSTLLKIENNGSKLKINEINEGDNMTIFLYNNNFLFVRNCHIIYTDNKNNNKDDIIYAEIYAFHIREEDFLDDIDYMYYFDEDDFMMDMLDISSIQNKPFVKEKNKKPILKLSTEEELLSIIMKEPLHNMGDNNLILS